MNKPIINLNHGNCMEAMKSIPDNYYDLAIVDPPYGIGVDGGIGGGVLAKKSKFKKKGWDNKAPDLEYFNELIRVSKNQIIWGANHFVDRIPYNSSCWVVWDKDNGKNNFADCELAYTSFKSSVRKFKYKWQGMLQENMKYKEVKIHPTQKPVKLYEWLLMNYAKEGDKILDTHGGSMSIAIACHNLGYDLDLWELDKDYYEAGKKRFIQHVGQLRMF